MDLVGAVLLYRLLLLLYMVGPFRDSVVNTRCHKHGMPSHTRPSLNDHPRMAGQDAMVGVRGIFAGITAVITCFSPYLV